MERLRISCRSAVCLPQAGSKPPSSSTKPTRELLSPACLCSSRNWGTHGAAVSFHGNADTFQTRASTNDRAPGACWYVAWNGVSLDLASYYSLSFLACLCSEGLIPPLLLYSSGVLRSLHPGRHRGSRCSCFTLVRLFHTASTHLTT